MSESDNAQLGEVAGLRLDRVLRGACLLAAAFLFFMGGVLVATVELFPGPEVAQAYQGGKALYDKIARYQDVCKTDLWFPARTSREGVTILSKPQVQEGATLYASGHEAAAFLISTDGRVLHEWRRPFSTVWNEHSGIKRPQPDTFVYFHKVKLLENGELLAIYEAAGDTPYGYGMVKLDRNSRVIWRYFGRTHHDFDVDAEGRIYALTHEFSKDRLPLFENLKPPRLDDFLVVLSPNGEELAKLRLIDAVAKSPYRHLLYTVSSLSVSDPLHANGVDVITPDTARNFAYGKPGEVLLSFRELNAIAVFNPNRNELVWATRGPWIGQHDPDILPNGNILLFDNYGRYKFAGGQSRAIEFNPTNMQIVWQYAGDATYPLDSDIRSNQERLANGNTFVVESSGGRMLEVTPSGEIVWQFNNPLRIHEGKPRVPIIAWAERVDPATVALAHFAPE